MSPTAAPQSSPRRSRFAGLGVRVATGLALAVGGVMLTLLAPGWLVAVVAAAAAGLGAWEYLRLTESGSFASGALAGLPLAAAVPLCALAGPAAVVGTLGLGLAVVAGLSLAQGGELAQAIGRLQRRGWGLLYVGGLLSCLVLLLGMPRGRWWLLFLLTVVVAADTGAYFAGHLAGRHKLAPVVSPGKTVEGLAGGLVLAGVAGGLYAGGLLPEVGLPAGAGLGVGLGAVSVVGDLVESALKRAAGAKDSGRLLPGHGGLLDRADGLMMAAPALLLARVLWWG